MDEQLTDHFPALQGRTNRPIDPRRVDLVRRVLWRAFQHGALTDDEFASTLDRLDLATSGHAPEATGGEG